eukprot:TRINITY_DN3066_c0_g1_i2.p2 TRINITY_DN3066_c0_g1~~TRINITY_DN3066_c0_g1_i2.p2  ORF type:complete len:118 (+),score=14.55 TRINITY_DN3066_c0_g1_i2:369-722(+)
MVSLYVLCLRVTVRLPLMPGHDGRVARGGSAWSSCEAAAYTRPLRTGGEGAKKKKKKKKKKKEEEEGETAFSCRLKTVRLFFPLPPPLYIRIVRCKKLSLFFSFLGGDQTLDELIVV